MKISHLSNIFMIYVNVKNKFLAVIILIGWLSGGIWVENNKTDDNEMSTALMFSSIYYSPVFPLD